MCSHKNHPNSSKYTQYTIFNIKQEMLQYVTNAPEGPLCATHLLIMLYLSVMFR